MSKLLKFKKLLTIEEARQLLAYLINQKVTLKDINQLISRGFLIAYSHKYLYLAEVTKTKDHFYKIINKNINLALHLVPSLEFSYLHVTHGKIYLLSSNLAKNKKYYALIDEQGKFIDNCIEKDNRRLVFLPSDIYKLAEDANKNEAIPVKHGEQSIPVDVFNIKTSRYTNHLSLIYYYDFDKDELVKDQQKALTKKVSENNQQVAIGLLIELLIKGERCPKQETIIEAILTNHPKIHGISRTTLANLFSDANKQLIEAIKK